VGQKSWTAVAAAMGSLLLTAAPGGPASGEAGESVHWADPTRSMSATSLSPERGPRWKDDPRLRPVGAPPTAESAGPSSLRRSRPTPNTDTATRALALGAVPCEDGSGALCGGFTVALDRRRPHGRTAVIDFKLFVHTEPGPAVSTVWWNGGGPGPSTTRNEPWLPGYLFGDLLGTFDLLLTDVRGTGSTAPECPELQSFEGYYPGEANHAPIAACAASIADRLDTYGSADSARDLDALRAALRIPKLDIIGNSYGAFPATAYALRFPNRTRSLIISSGVDVGATLSTKVSNEARGIDRILDVLCTRSPACSAGVPDARAALAAGVQRLRSDPPEGDSTSANNPTPQHVRLTEPLLFTLLEESDNTFMSAAGEAPAALISLGNGDPAPALRLAADVTDMYHVAPYDVPANVDSAGGYSAIECSDYKLPWPRGLTPEQRIDAAAKSVRPLDARGDMGAWKATNIVRDPVYADWEQLINCNQWPDVRAEQAVPDNVRYPRIPTLVVTSDLDPRTPLEDAQRTARRWPNAQLLNIGGALHGAALWSCGPDRVRSFLTSPGALQEPCDPAELPAFRAVGEFPPTSSAARPLEIDPAGTDTTTETDRRLAATALEAALDANSVSTRQPGLGTGVGLRGGTFETSGDDTQFQIDLHDNRFASDVAVNGTMVFPFDGSTPTIDITFTTDDGTTGHLTVDAHWEQGRSAAEPNVVPVRGTIEDRQVALLLPL
jgi:pimeloyl-ACP methyl ester carboxylesterase